MRQLILAMLLVTILGALATAQRTADLSSPPPPPPPPLAPAPSPDSQPRGLIHFDFSSMNMDQVNVCAAATLSCIPNPESRDRQQKLAKNRIAQLSKWTSSFKAAGGKDVFAVIGGWNGQIELDEVIVPLDGTNPDELEKTIRAFNSLEWVSIPQQSTLVGKSLVFSWSGSEKTDNPLAHPRPEWADALGPGRSAAFRAALPGNPLNWTPSGFIYCMMTGESPLGDAPSNSPLISISVTSISLCISPKGSVAWSFQCADAKSADTLSDYMNAGFANWREKIKESSADEKGVNPQQNAMMAAVNDQFSKLLAAMKPKAVGSRVTTMLDQDAVGSFILLATGSLAGVQ